METTYRVAGVVVLSVVLLCVCVHYGGSDRRAYPDPGEIADQPTAHDGERVLVFGEVISVDQTSETFVLESETPDRPVRFRIDGVSSGVLASLESGGSLQVYGTLRENSAVVVAEEVVVDFHSPTDFWYVYATSVFGGLLATGYVLRHWRVDIRRLRLQPRGES